MVAWEETTRLIPRPALNCSSHLKGPKLYFFKPFKMNYKMEKKKEETTFKFSRPKLERWPIDLAAELTNYEISEKGKAVNGILPVIFQDREYLPYTELLKVSGVKITRSSTSGVPGLWRNDNPSEFVNIYGKWYVSRPFTQYILITVRRKELRDYFLAKNKKGGQI